MFTARMSTSRRGRGLRCALLSGAGALAIAVPGLAAAQDEIEEEAASVAAVQETILVTGSRIRGVAPVGSPMVEMGRAEIDASSALTADRMLRELPQVMDLGVSENSRGQSGGNSNITYGNSVNLRGIGAYATLILVDGHRVVGNSRSVDPSIIPSLALERIEVVADGASAIYGSDAVAGVVNLIPRRDFDGVEALARYGFADGFEDYQLGFAAGQTWDSGYVMFAYEHVYRSSLSGDDRDFFTSDQRARGGGDYRVNQCSPGNIIVGGVTYAIPEGGVTPETASQLQPGTVNLCESNPGQDLFPETSYDSLATTFSQNLTPSLTLFGDAFFSKRDFERFGAIGGGNLTVPSTNAFFVAPPGTNPDSVTVPYRFTDDMPRNPSSGFTRSWQGRAGLRLDLPGEWQAEGYASYGKTRDESNSRLGVNNNALNAALASSDPETAFDPFGLNRTRQAVIDDIAVQVFLAPTKNELMLYSANLDGPIFEMWGNQARIAVGAERQEIATELGTAIGTPDTPLTFRRFERDVNSVYAELYLPLVGPANARPGIERLDLTAAIRYDEYSDVGDTTNPKFGLVWEFSEALSFRGSYGTSFRAPIFSQIHGNSNAMFVQNYSDPSQGGALTTGLALAGPNLDMRPEEASTWTLGGDLNLANGFRLGVTYFDVDYEGQVEGYLSDLGLLGRASDFDGTGIILRGADAAQRVAELQAAGIPILGVPPADIDLFVDGRNFNLGRSITRGIDVQASYDWTTDRLGDFTVFVNGTYLTDFQTAVTPAADLRDERNRIFRPVSLKVRGGVSWTYGDHNLRLQLNHIGSYDNTLANPVQEVDAYTTADLGWRYDLSGLTAATSGLTLGVDARNLFDTDPPYVNLATSGNGSGGYDATLADPIGRMISVSIRKRW